MTELLCQCFGLGGHNSIDDVLTSGGVRLGGVWARPSSRAINFSVTELCCYTAHEVMVTLSDEISAQTAGITVLL